MICVVCYHVIHVVYDAYLFDVCCGVYDVFMICVLFLVVCVCVCVMLFLICCFHSSSMVQKKTMSSTERNTLGVHGCGVPGCGGVSKC